ncbi:MAG: aminoacyl-histidine dipeptidase [Bacteroides sp.]|nr:aminoacyl-histidine dipeptidase [Bacteroides sp.]
MKITDLNPKGIFHYFNEICKVPRPSKKEEKILAYLKQFAEEHQLEYQQDKIGNLLIKKEATTGKEKLKTIILQSHVDMVCEKNREVEHDFDKDAIIPVVEGEWLKAKGTTLGADNGIGVATQLAILAADDIKHGPIECLFTVDEETALTGAFHLEKNFLSGDILLNLDSEDEGEIFIGCAGGIDSVANYSYKEIDIPTNFFFFKVEVKGLTGGHSGGDIHLGRGNANKILNRFLSQSLERHDLYVCEIEGGNLRNAIPREAHAICAIPNDENKHNIRAELNIYMAEIEEELGIIEPNFTMTLESVSAQPKAIDRETIANLVKSLYAVHHGVYSMSQDIPGLVETSSNLASIKMMEGNKIKVETSQRSSITSSRDDMAKTVRSALELGGAEVTHRSAYPGWKPNTHSPILEVAEASYERLFGKKAAVKAIHAGLECGLFLDKYPQLDMISFGPTMRGVHSPDERLHIPSVDTFWKHLLDILEHIPEEK